jgi:FAD/FMN-containing dehydrogenase
MESSVTELAEEARTLASGNDPSLRGEVLRVLERLFDRLWAREDLFLEFGDDVQETAGALRWSDAPPRVEDGRFRYRNVDIPWSDQDAFRDWPPDEDAGVGEEADRCVRVLGECWGQSPLAERGRAGALVLLTHGSPAGVRWGASTDRVRCGRGVTFDDVHEFLEGSGGATRRLSNQPGSSALTIAGNIGTGGHGSGLGEGPLSSMVTEIVVQPAGASASPLRFDRDHPDFDYALAHLGRLGTVQEMELEVRPAFRLRLDREILRLGSSGSSVDEDLQRLLEHAVTVGRSDGVHSVDVWLSPYMEDDRLIAALGVRRFTDAPVSPDHLLPLALRSKALQVAGYLLAIVSSYLNPRWMRGIIGYALTKTATNNVVMEPRRALDLGPANELRMGSIEMAFDISSGVDAQPLKRIRKSVDELSDQDPARMLFAPMGIRFVGRGPAAGLSPQAGYAATMHVELPTFGRDDLFYGDEVLARLQGELADLGGRPHWGHRMYLEPTTLRRLWPEASIGRMAALTRALDPRGVFANPLVDALLGI